MYKNPRFVWKLLYIVCSLPWKFSPLPTFAWTLEFSKSKSSIKMWLSKMHYKVHGFVWAIVIYWLRFWIIDGKEVLTCLFIAKSVHMKILQSVQAPPHCLWAQTHYFCIIPYLPPFPTILWFEGKSFIMSECRSHLCGISGHLLNAGDIVTPDAGHPLDHLGILALSNSLWGC